MERKPRGHSRRRSLQVKPSSPDLPMAHAYDGGTGNPLWNFSSAKIDVSPVVAGSPSISRRTRRPAPYAVDVGTGEEVWSYTLDTRMPARMPRSLPPRLRYRMASSTSALRTTVSMPSGMERPLNLHLSGGAERSSSRMGRPSRSSRRITRAPPIRSAGLQPSGLSMPPQRRAGLTTPSRRRMTG